MLASLRCCAVKFRRQPEATRLSTTPTHENDTVTESCCKITLIREVAMIDSFEEFLVQKAQISSECAIALSPYIVVIPDDVMVAKLGALRSQTRPDGSQVFVSRHARNLLINWKELLLHGIPAFAGSAVAIYSEPVAGSLACIAAVYELVKCADIELHADHSTIVDVLWRTFTGRQEVSIAEIGEAAPQISPNRLDIVLGDLAALGLIDWFGITNVVKKDDLVLHK